MLFNLFGRSPFQPLQKHMEKVAHCIHELVALFTAIKQGQEKQVQEIADHISSLEHAADRTKDEIRNNIPSSLFLSLDRSSFLEMLSLQDTLADKAEDIAVLVTLRPMKLLKTFEEPFLQFLQKNIDSFEMVRRIIQELQDLQESSFGGNEAKKVKAMVEAVAFKEHEADLLQRELLRALFASERELSYGLYIHWQKIFEVVGSLSNISEKLANCVRATLDVK